MTDPAQAAAAAQPCPADGAAPDLASSHRIAALRARGAQHADPVNFRFIEALHRRSAAHRGEARAILDRKLAQALTACAERLAQAGAVAGDRTGHDAGATRRGRPGPGPLADLVRRLDGQAVQAGGGAAEAGLASAEAPVELKALRTFRATWSRLSVDRQLRRSLAKPPENAGPLNSHLLVLRALALMDETAPAYLQRLMGHVETLLWLDQAGSGPLAVPAKSIRSERARQRKPGRGKTG
jgi:hypothetical protein